MYTKYFSKNFNRVLSWKYVITLSLLHKKISNLKNLYRRYIEKTHTIYILFYNIHEQWTTQNIPSFQKLSFFFVALLVVFFSFCVIFFSVFYIIFLLQLCLLAFTVDSKSKNIKHKQKWILYRIKKDGCNIKVHKTERVRYIFSAISPWLYLIN